MEVKQQIRGIILNTKEEAESISMIAEGTSGEMTVLTQDISDILGSVVEVMKQTLEAKKLVESIEGYRKRSGAYSGRCGEESRTGGRAVK